MALVTDEVAFLQSLVLLEGAHVAELGCGNADFVRRLIERAGVAHVDAFEVDRIQHAKNIEGAAHPKLCFRPGGAEEIGLGDASVDGAVMMKSPHRRIAQGSAPPLRGVHDGRSHGEYPWSALECS